MSPHLINQHHSDNNYIYIHIYMTIMIEPKHKQIIHHDYYKDTSSNSTRHKKYNININNILGSMLVLCCLDIHQFLLS